ncbi:MAG: D-aminoacylase [Rhodoferax sp.]|nr:D-aminoacylase [Rhodoferax sp.]
MEADLLIRNATVFDGTGTPPIQADLAVQAGRIVAVEAGWRGRAAQELDASGLIAAPGFLDIHTHSDMSLLLDGRAQSKITQGVTTDVTGNCGFSPFPINPQHMALHLDLLAGIGDDAAALTWHDLDGYRAAAQARGIAMNVAPLVGHGALRIAVMGVRSEAATPEELEAMRQLLGRMLDQGAFGMTTGLTYVPSRYAPTSELVALCEVLAERQRLYATHARDRDLQGQDHRYGPLFEALHLCRAAGVRVQYSHAAINTPSEWGTAAEWTRRFDSAAEQGLDAGFDVYPYDASSSALTQYLPPWVVEGGVAVLRERLSDPAVMQRAEQDLEQGWSAHRIPWLWDRVVLARSDGLLGTVEGENLQEAATRLGLTPARLVLDLCREGGNRVMVVLFYRTEQDMRTFLTHPRSVMGSDGSALCFDQGSRRPHPRNFGASVRVLGRFVRELGDLDLATAIAKMSGRVAERLRLHDRGRIAVGLAADIVVFDPEEVADRATYLAPARQAAGIRHVLVNGEAVLLDGSMTGARPGQVLRAP